MRDVASCPAGRCGPPGRLSRPNHSPSTSPAAPTPPLVERGDIADLSVDGREADQEWAARTTWRYATTVRRPDGEATRAELVFDGIDTIATILIDGTERLRTANMFRTYRLDVTEGLRRADSFDLVVELEPAVEAAEKAEARNPLPRPAEYVAPYNQLRKMACSFGWDWGPSTGTAGLWQPVELHTWNDAPARPARRTRVRGLRAARGSRRRRGRDCQPPCRSR